MVVGRTVLTTESMSSLHFQTHIGVILRAFHIDIMHCLTPYPKLYYSITLICLIGDSSVQYWSNFGIEHKKKTTKASPI